MTAELRQIVTARRSLGDQVAEQFITLERDVHAIATDAAKLVGVLLDAHQASALPPSAGMELLTLMTDVASQSARSRALLGNAHDQLRQLAITYNMPVAGAPACPPNRP